MRSATAIIGGVLAAALASVTAAPAAAHISPTWLTQFGSPDEDDVAALAPDGSGGIFVAGSTTGSLGGPSAGLRDAWLARYDATGEQVWLEALPLAPDGQSVGGAEAEAQALERPRLVWWLCP